MEHKSGYVYHIKDEYFLLVRDDKLMQNKEGGNYRPTFFCVRDDKTSLLWMVPMSTRYSKYEEIHNRDVQQYGQCLKIVLGKYDGVPAAFLLQNMFPITEKYLDHIHTRNGNPIPVQHSIQETVKSNCSRLRALVAKGLKVVFPDIMRMEKMMIDQLNKEVPVVMPTIISVHNKLERAKQQCAQRDAESGSTPPCRGDKPPER